MSFSWGNIEIGGKFSDKWINKKEVEIMGRVIVEFSVIPLGTGDVSVSKEVTKAVKEVAASGLKYQLTPSCTIIEGDDLSKVIEVVLKAHEAVFETGSKRVVTRINIDDRRDKKRTMEEKVEEVMKNL